MPHVACRMSHETLITPINSLFKTFIPLLSSACPLFTPLCNEKRHGDKKKRKKRQSQGDRTRKNGQNIIARANVSVNMKRRLTRIPIPSYDLPIEWMKNVTKNTGPVSVPVPVPDSSPLCSYFFFRCSAWAVSL